MFPRSRGFMRSPLRRMIMYDDLDIPILYEGEVVV
jgi:hypothetical protein